MQPCKHTPLVPLTLRGVGFGSRSESLTAHLCYSGNPATAQIHWGFVWIVEDTFPVVTEMYDTTNAKKSDLVCDSQNKEF